MSGDINVQSFSGKVNISNNLLVGSSHLFVDTVNNRVGITTASPGASLEVNGNVHVGTDLTLGGTLTGDGSGLTNVNSDSGLWAGAGTGSVYLSTSTDKVGIGTTSPDARLHVEEPSAISATTRLFHTDNAFTGGSVGHFEIVEKKTGAGTGWSDFTLRLQRRVDSTEQGYIEFNPSGSTGDYGIAFGTGATETMRIDALNGNVGIGTTSPGGKLDIRGSVSDPSIPTVHIGDNAADFGDYGMVNLVRNPTNAGSKAHLAFIRGGNTIFSQGYYNDTNTFGFWPSFSTVTSTPAMAFATNGNVGIGTVSPGYTLDVQGDINSTGKINIGNYAVGQGYMTSRTLTLGSTTSDYGGGSSGWNTNTAAILLECSNNTEIAVHDGGTRVASLMHYEGSPNRITIGRDMGWGTISKVNINGNVGIGVTNPSYKLDVSGNLRVTTGILDTSWCSGSWLQTCTQSPTVTVYSNNGGGPMSTPGHGGSGMGGNRGVFTARKTGNYLISCCAVHMGRGGADASGTNLLVVFDAVGTNWNLNNVINTYDEIIDLRVAPTAEEAYTFACQVYMDVGHYFSFRVHSSAYIDNNAKLLCSAALVR